MKGGIIILFVGSQVNILVIVISSVIILISFIQIILRILLIILIFNLSSFKIMFVFWIIHIKIFYLVDFIMKIWFETFLLFFQKIQKVLLTTKAILIFYI